MQAETRPPVRQRRRWFCALVFHRSATFGCGPSKLNLLGLLLAEFLGLQRGQPPNVGGTDSFASGSGRCLRCGSLGLGGGELLGPP
eukprot:7736601-Alexandrium_andersonii.AAC.1